LLETIVRNDLPFLFAEDQSFVKFVKSLNPRFTPLRRQQTRDRIVAVHAAAKQRLQHVLGTSASMISFTTDLWTSSNKKSIMGITAHWVDLEYQMKECVLAFRELSDAHSGSNIMGLFMNVLNEFDVVERVRIFMVIVSSC
jgi:hypothetical protein